MERQVRAAIILVLFFINILSICASLDDEYGVDHDMDRNDPSYKYKMRGIKI